jgi:hypothetical protein
MKGSRTHDVAGAIAQAGIGSPPPRGPSAEQGGGPGDGTSFGGESGRRMAQTVAHLVDRVIPPVDVRQWGISVPKRVRCFLADRQSVVARSHENLHL